MELSRETMRRLANELAGVEIIESELDAITASIKSILKDLEAAPRVDDKEVLLSVSEVGGGQVE